MLVFVQKILTQFPEVLHHLRLLRPLLERDWTQVHAYAVRVLSGIQSHDLVPDHVDEHDCDHRRATTSDVDALPPSMYVSELPAYRYLVPMMPPLIDGHHAHPLYHREMQAQAYVVFSMLPSQGFGACFQLQSHGLSYYLVRSNRGLEIPWLRLGAE